MRPATPLIAGMLKPSPMLIRAFRTGWADEARVATLLDLAPQEVRLLGAIKTQRLARAELRKLLVVV